MFIQQHCFQQNLHQMMTLGSGIVSGPKHHYHKPKAPHQYLTTPPDFVRLLSLYGIAISTLLQLELFLGSFPRISSCLMEEVQGYSRMRRLS